VVQGSSAAKAWSPLPKNGYYTVQIHDTLYAIAWRYNIAPQDLAQWNLLDPPYLIFPGKKLRLSRPVDAKPPKRVSPHHQPVRWYWPHPGKILADYGAKPGRRSGLEIGGRLGDAIKAAADGVVVYSGSGLPRYGKLIIVKHNDDYFSAYGFNQTLLVQEKQHVKAGQVISHMGRSPQGEVKLHFVVRYLGKAVDTKALMPAK